MKRHLFLALLASSCSISHANDFGIGVSLKSNQVYLPININKLFRVEPSILLSMHNGSEDSDNRISRDRKSATFKVGFFRLYSYRENIFYYAGSKIGISRTKSITNSSYSWDEGRTEYNGSDFILEPAFGFEYFFNDEISLTGEASLEFTREFGSSHDEDYAYDDNNNPYKSRDFSNDYETNIYSQTEITIRMYF